MTEQLQLRLDGPPPPPPPDQAARQRITEDLDTTLFVEAGAGHLTIVTVADTVRVPAFMRYARPCSIGSSPSHTRVASN